MVQMVTLYVLLLLTTNGAYLCALLMVVMVQPGFMPPMLMLLQIMKMLIQLKILIGNYSMI